MEYLTKPLKLMTTKEMLFMHQKTVELLESTGFCIEHDAFLDALEACGAEINRAQHIAKIPAEITEKAAREMSGSPCLLKNDAQMVDDAISATLKEFLGKPMAFAFGGSALEVIGEDHRTSRPAHYKDLERLVRFGNGNPRIQYVGGPPVLYSYDAKDQTVPPEIREISGMAFMAKHCTKLGAHCPSNAVELDFAVELCQLLTGTTQDKLNSPTFLAPFLGPRCSDSPLRITQKAAETLYHLALRGLPIILAPMPLAGGTSPVTPASAILIANAEILGLIVALWAVGTQSVHNHVALTGIIDMRTTIASFSSPNVVLQDIGLTQLQKYVYGLECMCPTDYIDAKYPGYQSGSERSLKIATIAVSGHQYPSVGQLKSGLVCSAEQACLDIEAFDWMHHFMRGVDVSEESVCFDLIQKQGIGGNFLEADHTYKHYKDAFFFPRLSDRNAHEIRDMVEMAQDEVEKILARTPLYTRDPAICAEIDRLYDLAKEKCSI
jgi:trimethylamine---corrinoid protein Co-methyltransferase